MEQERLYWLGLFEWRHFWYFKKACNLWKHAWFGTFVSFQKFQCFEKACNLWKHACFAIVEKFQQFRHFENAWYFWKYACFAIVENFQKFQRFEKAWNFWKVEKLSRQYQMGKTIFTCYVFNYFLIIWNVKYCMGMDYVWYFIISRAILFDIPEACKRNGVFDSQKKDARRCQYTVLANVSSWEMINTTATNHPMTLIWHPKSKVRVQLDADAMRINADSRRLEIIQPERIVEQPIVGATPSRKSARIAKVWQKFREWKHLQSFKHFEGF